MQTIIQTISLEDFKTRYPLTYPSLKNGYLVFVDESSLKLFPNANYNTIPLGINEDVCGSGGYYQFTPQMGDLYKGKVIDYITLQKWYKWFLAYYQLLYSNECHGPYSSATEYNNSVNTSSINDSTYMQMDVTFNEHGGERFYRWLSTYYFISLDFMNEYFTARDNDGIAFTKTPKEWLVCVNNLPNTIMYYPDICEFFAQIKKWYDEFKNITKIDKRNCCDYTLYQSYGGDDLYKLLNNWIDKESKIIQSMNSLVEANNTKLIPTINIKVPLKQKLEDFGNLVSFSKDFILGRVYHYGNVCTYNDNVYILTKPEDGTESVGFIKDPNTGLLQFDTKNWIPYAQYYQECNLHEFNDINYNIRLSGRTTSSLDAFEQTVHTLDNLGNILEGHFKASSGSTFMQPPENTLLGLKYELGKAVNPTYISEGKYTGDVLMSIKFYYKNTQNRIIESTVMSCNEGDNILDVIANCQMKAIESGEYYADNIYADFIYYKGCQYSYEKHGDKYYTTLIKTDDYIPGIQCIDHCTLTLMTGRYCLSANESYPIRYYKVNKDIENKYSDEYGTMVNVAMCDWFLDTVAYKSNDIVISPALRKEELIGYSLPENSTGNIYIDRGYCTVLDKHLKMGEISSFDAIEKYGNGSFQLIKLEEA